MNIKVKKLILASIGSGFGMWVIAGLWHNLILPSVNENIHPHHEGIGILLISYFILSFLMSYIYQLVPQSNNRFADGLKIGILVGVLWVFPHGLAMAGAHNTSIMYEIKNTIWHIVEQGLGGIIIAWLYGKR